MPTKEQLINKLTDQSASRNFTKRDLTALMQKCGCIEMRGGRGSGVAYFDPKSRCKIVFDLPHPQKELKRYHKKLVIEFLKEIGDIKNEK